MTILYLDPEKNKKKGKLLCKRCFPEEDEKKGKESRDIVYELVPTYDYNTWEG